VQLQKRGNGAYRKWRLGFFVQFVAIDNNAARNADHEHIQADPDSAPHVNLENCFAQPHISADAIAIAASWWVCRGRSKKFVVNRRQKKARAACFAPDTVIDAARIGANVIARIEFFVVNDQLTMKEMQFFNSAVAMWRIVCSRCESYQHADAVVLRYLSTAI
jgi:hypothetical protein